MGSALVLNLMRWKNQRHANFFLTFAKSARAIAFNQMNTNMFVSWLKRRRFCNWINQDLVATLGTEVYAKTLVEIAPTTEFFALRPWFMTRESE